jgi:branched-chain amino acid transport system permease protein
MGKHTDIIYGPSTLETFKTSRPEILRNLPWLLAIGVIWLISTYVTPLINAYYFSIVIYVGINIVLAVSLNLVNGFTGQFSMGHAGFMAVGGYTSAFITTTLKSIYPTLFEQAFASHAVFLGALLAGALAASFAGYLVGLPSLRLKGDYLAIVTLGFGEIIRVFILNIDLIGGARGMP